MKAVLSCATLILVPITSNAATMELESYQTTDPLGYECSTSTLFTPNNADEELVFTAASSNPPRQCLPDPCQGALTQEELAELSGTNMSLPRFQSEWDDYYSRYADHCRKETVGPVAGSYRLYLTNGFWGPLLDKPVEQRNAIAALAATPTGSILPTTVSSAPTSNTKSGEATVASNQVAPTYLSQSRGSRALAMSASGSTAPNLDVPVSSSNSVGPKEGDPVQVASLPTSNTPPFQTTSSTEVHDDGNLSTASNSPTATDKEPPFEIDTLVGNSSAIATNAEAHSGEPKMTPLGPSAIAAADIPGTETVDVTPVPLPASWLLLGTSILILKRRRKAN